MPPVTRLAAAVDKGLAGWAATHGLTVMPGVENNRGGSVRLVNEHATIRIVADWLEGELTVTVQQTDGDELALADLVDLRKARGLSLTRLSRGISEDAVVRRLRQIANLLDDQAAPLFTASE